MCTAERLAVTPSLFVFASQIAIKSRSTQCTAGSSKLDERAKEANVVLFVLDGAVGK